MNAIDAIHLQHEVLRSQLCSHLQSLPHFSAKQNEITIKQRTQKQVNSRWLPESLHPQLGFSDGAGLQPVAAVQESKKNSEHAVNQLLQDWVLVKSWLPLQHSGIMEMERES